MSKPIKITQEYIDQMVEDFKEFLQTSKMSDGRVNYSKSFTKIEEEACLTFSEVAWLKMQALVREFDKEVAWHGIASRGDDDAANEYYIDDIVVYPQEVTGTTVNTDQVEYQKWLMELDDDTYDHLRMQGHSHVNMGVTPSSVDTALYEKMLDGLPEDDFFIFLIWNKKNDRTIKIYDLKKNILFETDDVRVFVEDDKLGLEKFMDEANEMVQTKKVAPATPAKPAKATEEKKPVSTAAPAPASSGKVAKVSKKQYGGVSGYSRASAWLDEDDDEPYYEAYRKGYGGYYYGGY